MRCYYVSGIPFGDELYHYRTKGSKNGVSTTPGYKAVGELANKAADSVNTSSSGRHYVDPNGDPHRVGHSGAAGRWGSRPGEHHSDPNNSQKKEQQNDKAKRIKRMKKKIDRGKNEVDKFFKRRNAKSRP